MYSMFQDSSRHSIEIGFGEFETRLKLIKFGLRLFLSHNSDKRRQQIMIIETAGCPTKYDSW